MSSVPLHYVDLRAFAYATEDAERVETALRTFLPEDFEVEVMETEGHYGDPITVFSARVERADQVRHVLDQIGDLADGTIDRLADELDDRVDENTSFYATFDKQAAYDGEVALGDGITVRAKVEAYPAKREAAIENAREVLGDL
ncbi:RNA-binding protein [Halobacteriales archaeon Cl-PHB]